MAKYLTKAQVVADFKYNYVPKVAKDNYEKTWALLLEFLYNDKAISEHQYNTWKYPTNEIS